MSTIQLDERILLLWFLSSLHTTFQARRGALKFWLVEVVYEWEKVWCEAFCYIIAFSHGIYSIQIKYNLEMIANYFKMFMMPSIILKLTWKKHFQAKYYEYEAHISSVGKEILLQHSVGVFIFYFKRDVKHYFVSMFSTKERGFI